MLLSLSLFQARLRLGLYSEYLAEWYKVFPDRQQTLVVRMEDYSKDRLATLNTIYKHIGLGNTHTIYTSKPIRLGNIQHYNYGNTLD